MTRTYEFRLVLNADPNLDATDRLYGYFGAGGGAPPEVQDVTLVVANGVPVADCTVVARSFDEALSRVLPALRDERLRVVRVEMDEEGLAILEAAA